MVTPEQLFAEAKKWFASATSESDYRAVIERAYYAAFHAANELEKSLPVRSTYRRQGVGDHESLFLTLEHPDQNLDYALQGIGRYIAVQLRIMRPLRTLATYKIHNTVAIIDVEEALAAAVDVMEECANGQRKVTQTKRSAAA